MEDLTSSYCLTDGAPILCINMAQKSFTSILIFFITYMIYNYIAFICLCLIMNVLVQGAVSKYN